MTDDSCAVLIVGGGLGGVAAALAAADAGVDCILTEPTEWIGGQLTSQAVPPDEHPWIEQFGSTATYRELRSRIRDAYRRSGELSDRARSELYLNPGRPSVSAIGHEPRVALAVLEEMLNKHVASGSVRILLGHTPVSAQRDGDRIRSVVFRNRESEEPVKVTPGFVLDASETGELLPLAGIPYVTGTEARSETGEPHAPEEARPQEMQGFTWCLAVDYLEGEDHVIPRPAQYERWTAEHAPVRPAPQMGWPRPDPRTAHERTLRPNPDPASDEDIVVSASYRGRFDPPPGYRPVEDLWRFRRVRARGNFPADRSDITILNWSANDYIAGSIIDVEDELVEQHLEEARQLTLSVLYWLQTEAPRPDGGFGFPGLRPRGDVLGTEDGLAMAPYIRESRRIRALYTVTENDFAGSLRETGAKHYFDTVGIGSYKMDLHPSTNGGERRYESAWPFEIPLGALISLSTSNFAAAAKNIGTTHLSNGCYRVHPVEWSIGEAAGTLAAHCIQSGVEPRVIRDSPTLLGELQQRLTRRGVELRWPDVRAY